MAHTFCASPNSFVSHFSPIMTSVNGSSVQEAFALMATLLVPRVPVRYLELSGQLLQRRQMEEVFEERAAAKRCAFPACSNPLSTYANPFSSNQNASFLFSTNLIARITQDEGQASSLFGSQGDLRRPLRAAVLLSAVSQGLNHTVSSSRSPPMCCWSL